MARPVFLFPGQGSQYVGMGKELHGAYPAVRALFDEASDVLGTDMRTLCFEGPADVLVQTENVQPAITLVDLSVHAVLREEGWQPSATAGHSLGEYSALCAADAFSIADTLRLVQLRGRAMQAAADRNPGGMAAVIGLDADTLGAICREVGGVVQVANHNSNSQVAITGERGALARATALAKERGAKLVVPLKVSGAWHSRLMEEAQSPMREALEACVVGEPEVPVIANVTAEPHVKDSVVDILVRQIVSPVRWATSMHRLIADGHSTFVEVGPGRVLTGFFKDIDRSVKAVSVQDADTLEKARTTLSEATA
jgi:[acyl-carrier-protein] S-malonyltransferase